MQISAINHQVRNPQFKSAYPVIHWVAETNGSYAPVASEQLTKKLQGKLVRYLNTNSAKAKSGILEKVKQVFRYIFSMDKDFVRYPIARSFYNNDGGLDAKNFEPISYLITGRHVDIFEEALAKPLGRCRRELQKYNGKIMSGELNIALGDYWNRGLNFVKKESKNFINKDGVPNELHTKFRVVRTKTGKIKDYELVDLRFLPKEGPENPFVKLSMRKK